MRLESLTLHHVKMPLRSPFQTSRWIELDRECLIVEARADGLTGWGECVAGAIPNYSYESTKTAWHILEDFLIPLVLDADLSDVPAYHALIEPISGHPMARAGLELALWDLFAQRAGQSLRDHWGGSLRDHWGGTAERVKVGVSVGIQESPERLLEVVEGYLADGYRRVKLKIKPGRDVSEVGIIRKHHPDLLLQGDGNSVYRIGDAARSTASAMPTTSRSSTTTGFYCSNNRSAWTTSSITPGCNLSSSRRSVSMRASTQSTMRAGPSNLMPARSSTSSPAASAAIGSANRSTTCVMLMACRSGWAGCSRPGSGAPPIWR